MQARKLILVGKMMDWHSGASCRGIAGRASTVSPSIVTCMRNVDERMSLASTPADMISAIRDIFAEMSDGSLG